MTSWVTETFGGLAPKIDDKRLADGLATLATNVDFDEARLSPLNDIAFEADLSSTTTQSLYKYNNDWLVSGNLRSYVGSMLPNDTDDKLYFSDYPSYPKMQSGLATYRLGLPKPVSITSAINTVGGADETLQETWIYEVAYVDAFGFEGPSSDPTTPLIIGDGGSVDITLPGAPTGNYNMGSGAVVRIYRSNAGTSASAFQYVTELPVATLTYTDSLPSAELQEVNSTYNNYPAPDENSDFGALRGLIELPGGILAGFTNNTVHLSKAYQPHAWPYDFASQHKILGIKAVQGGVFVATDERPYMLIGSSPENMNIEPLLSDQACLSEESIVDMGGFAIYASPDGLCSIQAGQVTVLTKELVDPESWNAQFNPTQIKAFNYEGKYVAFTGNGQGFSFDLSEGKNALTLHSGKQILAAHRVADEDKLYVIYKDTDISNELLGRWNEGTALALTWQTKVKQQRKPVAFSFLKIYGDKGRVTITVVGDDKVWLKANVPTDQLIRIPSQGKARHWQVKLETGVSVDMVGLFTAIGEVL